MPKYRFDGLFPQPISTPVCGFAQTFSHLLNVTTDILLLLPVGCHIASNTSLTKRLQIQCRTITRICRNFFGLTSHILADLVEQGNHLLHITAAIGERLATMTWLSASTAACAL